MILVKFEKLGKFRVLRQFNLMHFQHTKTPFVHDTFYHIYNRGNNSENIFFNEANYIYFLKQYIKYIDEFVDTYAYCLLPNHFHILIKIKPELEINPTFNISNIDCAITEQFRRLFMSYSKAINKQEKRKGSLFQRNLKIKPVLHINHLILLISYIHTNPIHHKYSHDFINYRWSSYKSILGDKSTRLKRAEIIELFG